MAKENWNYTVVHAEDPKQFREQIKDMAEQGFDVDTMSTCCGPSGVVKFTAIMRKKPEGPQIEEGPDPTGGTPAAGKVIPFRNLLVKAAA